MVDKYIKNVAGEEFVYRDEFSLIEEGFQWLSKMIKFKNETAKPNKSQCYAAYYAQYQSRIINRTKQYLEVDLGRKNKLVTINNLHYEISELISIIIQNIKPTTCNFCKLSGEFYKNPSNQWICAYCHPTQ